MLILSVSDVNHVNLLRWIFDGQTNEEVHTAFENRSVPQHSSLTFILETFCLVCPESVLANSWFPYKSETCMSNVLSEPALVKLNECGNHDNQ